jgi:polyphosphate kinase 2 (PPK2 family)
MNHLGKLAKPYRVDDGKHFRLRDFHPAGTGKMISKKQAASDLKQGVEQLSDLQGNLYAQHRWAVLLIFQATDAAGKDGTIKHVMSGVHPAGCEVHS